MPTRRRLVPSRSLLALAVLVALAPPLQAQEEEPATGFAGEVTVSEVVLDVVVTDARGQVVVGLQPHDFRVEEDGREVDVREVVFYSHRELMEPAASPGELNVDPDLAAHRYFVLLFHDQRQLSAQLAVRQLDAARWAKRWVRTRLRPRDLVAVVSWQYGLRPQADFSNDPEVLARAIDRAIVSEETPPSRLPEVGVGVPSLLASLPSGEALSRATTTLYGALEVLADAAGAIAGRKNLVLLSTGLRPEGDPTVFRPDPRYFPRVTRALNDANVAVYSVDLAPGGASSNAAVQARSGLLSYLAHETGGDYYSTYVTLAAPFGEIDEATSGYYLITYESRRPAGESGYQKVDVTTVNPRFRARGRQGYLYGESVDG